MENQTNFAELTASVIAAYVANNAVPTTDLPGLINSVHRALAGAASGKEESPPQQDLKPVVSVRKSVTPDHIICLEDGKKFKSLKRHLLTSHDLTPEQYRQKWNLASDYPMVAPNYAEARSKLAKDAGLGQKRAGKKKSAGK